MSSRRTHLPLREKLVDGLYLVCQIVTQLANACGMPGDAGKLRLDVSGSPCEGNTVSAALGGKDISLGDLQSCQRD